MTRLKIIPLLSLLVLVLAILGGAAWLYLRPEIGGGGGGKSAKFAPRTKANWPVGYQLPIEAQAEYDRVILVSIDTLRADHLSSNGYQRRTTPFLDGLARQGVSFQRAVASVSHTAPSHATMMTGLAPAEHGVVINGLTLSDDAQDLASMFGDAGYETAAFLNVRFLSGITKNFDKSISAPKRGGGVVESARRWLESERSSERFFMWVHLYDPHHWKDVKRTPKRELDALRKHDKMSRDELYAYFEELHSLKPQIEGEPFDLGWVVEIKNSHRIPTRSRDDYLDFVDAYDAQIFYADRLVRSLYQTVEDLDLPGRTLWIITSDHGEGLASHQIAGHGGRIYQEQLLVPLIFHASDGGLGGQGGRRVENLVQHIDLYPTLAATCLLYTSPSPRDS